MYAHNNFVLSGGGDDIAHVFTGAMILDAPDADWD